MDVCCLTTPSSAPFESGRPEIRLLTNQAFAANLELYAKRGYASTAPSHFAAERPSI